MANVAGISQLMETALPATQTPSTSPASEHSFAAVMRQANTDAGTPVAPVARKAPPKAQGNQNDPGQTAENNQQGSATAAGKVERPSVADAIKAAPPVVAPQTSFRYSPANMLAAMLGHSGGNASVLPVATYPPVGAPAVASTAATFPQTSLDAKPSPAAAPPAIAAAPAANGSSPARTPTLDSRPVDLSVAAPPRSTASADPAKSTSTAGASTPQVPARSVPKQDAPSKSGGSMPAPALTAAALPASVSAVVASPTPVMVAAAEGASSIPTAATDVISPVKAPAANSLRVDTNGPVGQATASAAPVFAVQPPAPSTGQPGSLAPSTQAAPMSVQAGAASFKQSLAATPVEPAAVPATSTESVKGTAADIASETGAAERPLPTAIKQPAAPAIQPNAAAAPPPQAHLAPVADTPSTGASTATPVAQNAAGLPSSGAVLPVPVPASATQTAPAHKSAGKPSLFADAPRAVSAATSPAASTTTASPAVQPSASTSAADGKAAPHVPAAAVVAPATAPSIDGSTSVATPLAVAHTPVAVTALNNPAGPGLASTPVIAATSTMTADSLQHTTLTSTPTTLEVGVASGTHGWLKIRAELNASGTVDASLTGTNAAATGKLHNDLPALSSFLQEERVAVGSLNVAAPGAANSVLHATIASTLEPTSSFTRSAAEGVGAAGTAVASDAGASGGRASQQQAPEASPSLVIPQEGGDMAGAIVAPLSALYGEGNYGEANEMAGGGALSESGGGSWLNVRV